MRALARAGRGGLAALALGGALGLLGACSDEGGGGEGVSGSSGQPGAAGGAGAAGVAGGGAGAAGEAGGAGAAGAAGEAGQGGGAGQAGQGGGAGAAGAAGSAGKGPPTLTETLTACQGSDQAFVRRALPAILGRRPYGQAEVQAYVDLMAAVDKLEPGGKGPAGSDLRPARRVAAMMMMGREEYLTRWIDAYRDFLRVQRTEDMSNPGCYGQSMRVDGTAIAAMVRDQPPDTLDGDGLGAFTMRDLLLSSLKLDDLSPFYVGNLFSMLVLTYPGANAEPPALELARRSDFGAWFDGVYLHRDPVCLRCHNTESSVTFSAEADKNRHFPLSGLVEQSLFGSSSGPAGEGDADGAARMHAPLRFDGFVNGGQARPWGWDQACGQFAARGQVPPDIAKVNAQFGQLTGDRTSAWDLATSLQQGFRKLRDHGLSRGPGGVVPDPDEGFAYLVAMNLVEQVWREVVGTPLTIANYFPRNAAARDQLMLLTEGFIASGFSHRQLLLQILQSPYFNLAPLDDECWPAPHALPALFDPWTKADEDPAARGNSPADAVVPRSARTTLSAAYRALGWDNPAQWAFPFRESQEGDFQASVGVFLKNAEPGFRGLDFQGRLGWEQRLGSCAKLSPAKDDVVDELLAAAAARPGSTVGDLVAALKDRIVGEGAVVDEAERAALEALLGASLGDEAAKVGQPELRRLCGVLLASPQFLLLGVVPPDQSVIPALTPAGTSYATTCQDMAAMGLPGGLTLTCEGATLTVTK